MLIVLPSHWINRICSSHIRQSQQGFTHSFLYDGIWLFAFIYIVERHLIAYFRGQ